MRANRLKNETSPYLLQHANNPVDWQAWSSAALEEAKLKNRPILLSIGYAACHWCHVMAHESFENEETAALMNKLFINIKVDREERPDLDTIYQSALQLLGQQGGWPLTMFLTPNGEPFWGGTYFPPEARYGRSGFPQILETIHNYWIKKQSEVKKNVEGLRTALTNLEKSKSGAEISLKAIEKAALQLAQEFDNVNGGIGTAPKFPNPTILELLWRTYKRNDDQVLRDTVLISLEKMCQGGIYDHLAGGFARYSTDAKWLVPHFEKMLYDNAQILELITWAWQETKSPLFAARARETVSWLLNEMIVDGGGFAATLDADSEGEEGRFYVWGHAEVAKILVKDTRLFAEAYNVTVSGNWEGKTILNRNTAPRNFTEMEESTLANCRVKLLQSRNTRVRPGWDDKVLADWNGLMIFALAHAGVAFDERSWVTASCQAFNFILRTMHQDGRLFHAYRNGKTKHAANLDDYANMIRAALLLFELTGKQDYLKISEEWIQTLDKYYWDQKDGGYFFTAGDTEALIIRTKSCADHATPSGNGVMVGNLARLFFMTGKIDYRMKAEETISAFSGELAENFFPLATLLNSAEFLQCAVQIVIIGDRAETKCREFLKILFSTNLPNRIISLIDPDIILPENHPAFGKQQKNASTTAYVCIGNTCSLPITNPIELKNFL